MKKNFIYLLLLCSLIAQAQVTPSYPTIKLTKTVEGVKQDSLLVLGADKIVKHIPFSKISSVQEFATASALPVTGVAGKLYITKDNNKIYTWNGTFYSEFFGAKGEKGDQGIQGIQGVAGLNGAKGDKGDVGLTGSIGLTGAKGDKGDIGLTGVAGTNGAKGDKGDQGLQGFKGDTGLTGADGAMGAQGPQGIQGIHGETGLRGIQGETGPQGPIGFTGEKGADGTGVSIKGSFDNTSQLPTSGAAGDAYLISGTLHVWNGTAWVNVGNIQGPQGLIGLTGATGSQGIQGVKGDKGDQGIQGIQGLKGDTGAKGDTGSFNGDLTADQVTETATRKFQTANQNTFNDATSSIQGQLNSKENSFSKNTAFNKNFGTSAGTVAEGNDSRINNGQTAFNQITTHTHGLGRHSLRAPALIDGLTTSNFRTTLFGTGFYDYNISTARWSSAPTFLSNQGMGSYSTMLAWSGDDTHGFTAVDYNAPKVIVGGGSSNIINWSKSLAFSDGTGANGTWGINISGNSSSATSWGGRTADFVTAFGNQPFNLYGLDNPSGIAKPFNDSQIKSWLGLGTNAYSSTAYLPLTGNAVTASELYNATNGGTDLNTATVGKHTNYSSSWYNSTGGPSSATYGTAYNFGGTNASTLSLQVLADVNHNSTSSTKDFYFRTGNNLGFQNDWKKMWHDGNFNPASYLPLSGGTLTGNLSTNSTIYVSQIVSYTGDINYNAGGSGNRHVFTGGNVDITGTVTAAGFFQSSDRRLKYIHKRDGDVAYYTWKDGRDDKEHIGYVAQEVQENHPNQVQADEKGILSVNYVEILVEKIRVLEKRIEQLEKSK